MFTHQQIEHYKAFGFVLVRGLLHEAEVEALTAEVAGSLTAAFGGVGTDTDPERAGGIRGDYLPLALDRTPVSQALMADDPRLFQGAADAHLFHSSAGGEKRLAWSIEYLPWGADHDTVRDYVSDIVDHTGYDPDAWPVWEEWATSATMPASRQVAIQRLRILGVLGPAES